MAATTHTNMQLRDRPEFRSKPRPLTRPADAMTADAVAEMSARDFGSVIVVDADERVIGVVTERDIMKRIVNEGRDPATTPLSEIMTRDPRVARETDDLLDWLRIMSNERFRRLPVVDADGRIVTVFTQGDFVSFTWPDLIYQGTQLAKASIGRNWALWLIGGGIMVYTLLMVLVLNTV